MGTRWACTRGLALVVMGALAVWSCRSSTGGHAGSGDNGTPSPQGEGSRPAGSDNVAPPVASSAAVDRFMALNVRAPDTELSFSMQAPLERIRGHVDGGFTGSVMVNPEDLSKMTGLVRADLDTLKIYQQTRSNEQGDYATETLNATQNKHARAWLEIGEDVPPEQREKNRVVEFRLQSVKVHGPNTLAALAQTGTKTQLLATGLLTLHGVTRSGEVELELSADITNGQLNGLRFTSTRPLKVELESFDVRPREAFGILAQKTLEVLAPKVAREADVSLEFTARPNPAR